MVAVENFGEFGKSGAICQSFTCPNCKFISLNFKYTTAIEKNSTGKNVFDVNLEVLPS